MLQPRSTIPGVVWPAIAGPAAARMLSFQFQLAQSERLPPASLRVAQARQLGALLAHAYATSPFHRRRLDAAGLSPDQVRNEDDWRRIPLLTRADWQIAGESLYSTAVPPAHGTGGQLVTSGSTGKPVAIRTTGLTGHLWHAFTLRDHLWHRRDFAGKLASVRFFHGGEAAYPDGGISANWGPATQDVTATGPSVMLNVSTGVGQQAEWLARQDPEYLLTYPSNVLALARHCAATGLRLDRLREVRTFGELLEPHVRAAVRKAWGVAIVDMYTSQEVGYIALQCPEQEHYHVQEENVLVEVLNNDGGPCQPGEVGRVVVTALHNFATPVLRYEIGDYAEVGEPRSCGRGLLVLKRIVGRGRNMIVLPNGELRWPSIDVDPDQPLASIPPVQQFQVIQRSLREVEMLLVMPRPLTDEERALMLDVLEKGLGHRFEVTFRYVDHIPAGPTGKYEDFRSEVARAPQRNDGHE